MYLLAGKIQREEERYVCSNLLKTSALGEVLSNLVLLRFYRAKARLNKTYLLLFPRLLHPYQNIPRNNPKFLWILHSINVIITNRHEEKRKLSGASMDERKIVKWVK